jgi:hypothetical protein
MMLPKCPTDKIYASAEAYRRVGEPDATSDPEAESIEESACHRVVEKPKIEQLVLDPQEASI